MSKMHLEFHGTRITEGGDATSKLVLGKLSSTVLSINKPQEGGEMFLFCKKAQLTMFVAIFTLISVSLLGITSTASASIYLPYGSNWYDANKTAANTDDDLMCWAAAASNILDWGNWDTLTFNTETLIFQNFQYHWTDQGSLMHVGWQWWLNGTFPPGYPYGPDWSTVDVPGGRNHYPALNFSDYFHEYWGSNTMLAIDNYLHAGYGVTLAIYDGGHAITCWGYQYDQNDPDYYQGVYITDSDDYKIGLSGLQYYDLNLHADGWWYFDDYYGWDDVWAIEGVQALEAIPEPCTIALLGSGLVALFGIGRKRLRRG